MTNRPPVIHATLTASRVIDDWPTGVPFRLEAVRRAYPDVEFSPSVELELAYEEFCDREDAGEQPTEQEYRDRFPQLGNEFSRLFEFHRKVAQATAVSWPSEGDYFDRYRLTRHIGCGAFSRVFIATDPLLADRLCIVKVTTHEAGEAHLLAKLRHSAIVPIENVVKGPSGLTGLVMPYRQAASIERVFPELVDDESKSTIGTKELIDALEKLGLPYDGMISGPQNAVPRSQLQWSLFRSALDGLAHAHHEGIVHGDLKPSNVLVCADGSALLIDFNLSTQRQSVSRGGTPGYMAPEQELALERQQSVPASTATDVYSMAAVGLELLTGGHWLPIDSNSIDENRRHRDYLLNALQKVSPARAEVFGKALAVDSGDRFDDAESFALALDRVDQLQKRRRFLIFGSVSLLTGGFIATAAANRLSRTVGERLRAAQDFVRSGDLERAFAQLSGLDANDLSTRNACTFAGILALHAADYNSSEKLLYAATRMGTLETSLSHEALAISLLATSKNNIQARASLLAIRRTPENRVRLSNNLGLVLNWLGQLDSAREHLAEALSEEPNLFQPLLNMAVVELRLAAKERRPVDQQYVRRALEVRPRSEIAMMVRDLSEEARTGKLNQQTAKRRQDALKEERPADAFEPLGVLNLDSPVRSSARQVDTYEKLLAHFAHRASDRLILPSPDEVELVIPDETK